MHYNYNSNAKIQTAKKTMASSESGVVMSPEAPVTHKPLYATMSSTGELKNVVQIFDYDISTSRVAAAAGNVRDSLSTNKGGKLVENDLTLLGNVNNEGNASQDIKVAIGLTTKDSKSGLKQPKMALFDFSTPLKGYGAKSVKSNRRAQYMATTEGRKQTPRNSQATTELEQRRIKANDQFWRTNSSYNKLVRTARSNLNSKSKYIIELLQELRSARGRNRFQ